MEKSIFETEKRTCISYYQDRPEILLIQPADEHDIDELDHQAELIRAEIKEPFLLTAFRVTDWNRDLSPWPAPAVFGKEDFGGGAAETLRFVESQLIPALIERFGLRPEIPVIPGGYSLAGLFTLWSAYQTDCFTGIAAVSPSVWFSGWTGYAECHRPHADFVYLSLGNKEEKTRNPQMARVGSCIRTQHELLKAQGISCELEWNEGNHFKEPDVRTAKGFISCIKAILSGSS